MFDTKESSDIHFIKARDFVFSKYFKLKSHLEIRCPSQSILNWKLKRRFVKQLEDCFNDKKNGSSSHTFKTILKSESTKDIRESLDVIHTLY